MEQPYPDPKEELTFPPWNEDLTWMAAGADIHVATFVFTGNGSEYFRIWVINLLLILMTLGLYSPWAKVRKAKYFRNNTRFEGHVFDYHGDPRAILRGRIIALFLFALYSWAFDFSKEVGIATMLFLCAAAPWLFMRGQQFALTNTSFRGLRFGFRADLGEAYRTIMPVVILWLAPSLVGAFVFGGLTFGLLSGAIPFTFPWMHHRLKAYQHRNATYGDRYFSFTPALGRFYWAYFVALVLVMMTTMAVGVLLWWGAHSTILVSLGYQGFESGVGYWIFLSATTLMLYLVVSPYLATRLQQTIWNRTRLDRMCFVTNIRLWPLFRLVAGNVLMTVLSCGLYWPWAAVAMARYRIECLQLDGDAPFTEIVAGTRSGAVSATGDSAVDAFGFDIGI